jgi:hypothetical protein
MRPLIAYQEMLSGDPWNRSLVVDDQVPLRNATQVACVSGTVSDTELFAVAVPVVMLALAALMVPVV